MKLEKLCSINTALLIYILVLIVFAALLFAYKLDWILNSDSLQHLAMTSHTNAPIFSCPFDLGSLRTRVALCSPDALETAAT